MGYLLDTNALIFYLYTPTLLSKASADTIYDDENKIYVSIASLCAIAENLTIVTRDSIIPQYDVNTLW
jgi:PIN domain nuclease of toxin-antitoxin system